MDFHNAGGKEKNILFTNKMVQKRFVNPAWIKIAEHYANETHVAFELLNEVVEQENAEAWNLPHWWNGGRYPPNSQRHHSHYIRAEFTGTV